MKDWIIKKLGGKTATDVSIDRWRSTGGTSYASSRTFIGDVDDRSRLFLSLYEPVVYWIVTRVAQDVFNDWFTVVDVKNEDDMTLDEAVQKILTALKAKERLTRLFIFERRYGTALLLCRYSATSKDTWDTPLSESKKPELDAITPYPWTKVKVDEVDKDPASPTYAYPMKYKLSQGISGINDLPVDQSRTIRAATRLDEHIYEGLSIVDLIADDAVGYRTFRSGVYKLWVRYGSGMPTIKIPKASKEQLQTLEDEGYFDDMSNRSYFLLGKDIEDIDFKGAAGVSLDPTPTDNIGINNLSMASGVPSDILRGTQAGTLAGSVVDENQYFKRISSEQSLVEPTVRALIDILTDTGQVEFDGEYAIKWNSTKRVDDLDLARIEVMEATANEKKLKYMTVDEVREPLKLGPYPEPEPVEEPEANVDSVALDAPQTTATRTKVYFKLSEEEWAALTEKEKKKKIKALSDRDVGKAVLLALALYRPEQPAKAKIHFKLNEEEWRALTEKEKEEKIKGVSEDTVWRYETRPTASASGASCEFCLALDGSEWRESELGYFGNLNVVSADVIEVNYHMDLGWSTPCYCVLNRLEIEQ